MALQQGRWWFLHLHGSPWIDSIVTAANAGIVIVTLWWFLRGIPWISGIATA
eukprot:CAMPEP_0201922014 /NCGR_PEP_ID=MMETSP0903-20130614/10190_1 /ASSEMBLY_ACC=CAM_ASM_000552 /TAXON_ID=420261 /ORGANISM="Thalassiosira antarctica, Strain CCMP982" /LENGTH=51 /DNA_ID=CAMNT_0048459087 /DNA_START=104 /DNA_END=255 /DNA_ORIENTATION=-